MLSTAKLANLSIILINILVVMPQHLEQGSLVSIPVFSAELANLPMLGLMHFSVVIP